MDTKNLYYFQIVFEEGNIRTAAQKLYISPQGLGKVIKGLEIELDCPAIYKDQVWHDTNGKRYLFI